MAKFLLRYANGYGHLIMSIIVIAVGVFLYSKGVDGVGLGMIATVTSAWFIPNAAKQVAAEVKSTTSPLTEKK